MQTHAGVDLQPRRDRRFHLMETMRRDFRIMPQLAITAEQASRLWTLDRETCRHLLEGLVQEGFLRRRDGRYAVPGAFNPFPTGC